jgi:hypothetical protein
MKSRREIQEKKRRTSPLIKEMREIRRGEED